MSFINNKKPKFFSAKKLQPISGSRKYKISLMSKNLKNFLHDKKQFLRKPDKSMAGGIDKAILSLVKKINSSKDYFTTSSCAGRIVLMPETGKKQEKVFLFVSHNPISAEKVLSSLKPVKNIVYLKHEPCIMHVACKSIDKALQLVSQARNAGWKKSGIISIKPGKVMCELVSTEILAAPIADKGNIIIDNNYLKILLKECNNKLALTRQKIKQLNNEFRKQS